VFGKSSSWQAETFVCAWRGHVAPAATVARLTPEDAGIGVDLPDGRRFARCLRCDAWVAGSVPSSPAGPSLPPLHELELPRRDKELRQALLLRLIAIDRAVHSLLFGIVAVALVLLELKLGPLQHWASTLRDQLTSTLDQTGRNPSRGFILDALNRILKINKNGFGVLIATAVAYCVVEGVEAVGLWRERRWAEYLTALATAGFLPFEVHELIKRVTVLRVGALVVNIAVLIYLLWAKHLFGIGGSAGEDHGDGADRAERFGPPRPADAPSLANGADRS
jgi:uncharacterized membrane protein (DUF2068 family)